MLRSQFVKARSQAAATRHLGDEVGGRTQQFLEYRRAHLVRTGARGHLDRLKIETTALA
jgi:hypothetical protein